MSREMQLNEIENEIERLKYELAHVRGTQTEVYSRIVGYYRAVKNWNRGKREEYTYRKAYTYPAAMPEAPLASTADYSAAAEGTAGINQIASYQYFYRTTCPNCPPVKQYLTELGFEGEAINVDADDGFDLAGKLAVCAAPTVIFRDDEGNEILRASNVQDLIKTFSREQAVS